MDQDQDQNILQPNSNFLHRQEELQQAVNIFQQSILPPTVFVTGPAGTSKTSIVRKALKASRVCSAYFNCTCWDSDKTAYRQIALQILNNRKRNSDIQKFPLSGFDDFVVLLKEYVAPIACCSSSMQVQQPIARLVIAIDDAQNIPSLGHQKLLFKLQEYTQSNICVLFISRNNFTRHHLDIPLLPLDACNIYFKQYTTSQALDIVTQSLRRQHYDQLYHGATQCPPVPHSTSAREPTTPAVTTPPPTYTTAYPPDTQLALQLPQHTRDMIDAFVSILRMFTNVTRNVVDLLAITHTLYPTYAAPFPPLRAGALSARGGPDNTAYENKENEGVCDGGQVVCGGSVAKFKAHTLSTDVARRCTAGVVRAAARYNRIEKDIKYLLQYFAPGTAPGPLVLGHGISNCPDQQPGVDSNLTGGANQEYNESEHTAGVPTTPPTAQTLSAEHVAQKTLDSWQPNRQPRTPNSQPRTPNRQTGGAPPSRGSPAKPTTPESKQKDPDSRSRARSNTEQLSGLSQKSAYDLAARCDWLNLAAIKCGDWWGQPYMRSNRFGDLMQLSEAGKVMLVASFLTSWNKGSMDAQVLDVDGDRDKKRCRAGDTDKKVAAGIKARFAGPGTFTMPRVLTYYWQLCEQMSDNHEQQGSTKRQCQQGQPSGNHLGLKKTPLWAQVSQTGGGGSKIRRVAEHGGGMRDFGSAGARGQYGQWSTGKLALENLQALVTCGVVKQVSGESIEDSRYMCVVPERAAEQVAASVNIKLRDLLRYAHIS